MPTEQYSRRRRTTRLHFRVRVILGGKDAGGSDFAEDTETTAISKHGASLRTSHDLVLGQEVSVRVKDNDRAGQFQVVWAGRVGTPQEGLIGVEWLEARRFWGIEFPPEDWQTE